MIPVIPGCRGQIGIKNTLYETLRGGLETAFAALGRSFTYQKKEVSIWIVIFTISTAARFYYADLDPVTGHEQGGIRPVLVIQNDTGNYHSPTIIVIAVTRRTFKKPKQPTHVVLDDAQGLGAVPVYVGGHPHHRQAAGAELCGQTHQGADEAGQRRPPGECRS